jgi:hypothetical protein
MFGSFLLSARHYLLGSDWYMAVSWSLTIVDKSRKFITEMGYRNTTELNHVNDTRTTHGLLNSSQCINNHPWVYKQTWKVRLGSEYQNSGEQITGKIPCSDKFLTEMNLVEFSMAPFAQWLDHELHDCRTGVQFLEGTDLSFCSTCRSVLGPKQPCIQ